MKRHAPNRSLFAFAILGAASIAAPALAQPAPPAPPPPPAAAPAAPDPIAAALAPRPGGLTPDEVGKTASRTKHSVRAKQADLQAAAARVDQAFVGFFPRVSGTFTYTRLSAVTPF